MRCVAKRTLYDPIFDTMKTNHGQLPSRSEPVGRLRECLPQSFEFVIGSDTERLECFRCWVDLTMLVPCRSAAHDRIYQIHGRNDAMLRTRGHNRVRNSPRKTFFSIRIENIGELVLRTCIDDLCRGLTTLAIGHQEWLVILKRESTSSFKLETAPPEVKQSLVDLPHAKPI